MGVVGIAVTYNSAATISSLVSSAANQLDELIVVDNNSGDQTVDALVGSAGVKVIRNHANVGFARAVNIALRMAGTNDVILLNPDVVVPDGAVGLLTRTSRLNGDNYLLGPRLRHPNGDLQASARTYPTFLRMLARRSVFGRSAVGSRILERHVVSPVDSAVPVEVDWIIGAVMYVPFAVRNKIGLMDERYFLYCEDLDWCVTAWKRGSGVLYVPTVEMTHRYRRESRRTWRFTERATRSHWISLCKFFVKYPEVVLTGTHRARNGFIGRVAADQ